MTLITDLEISIQALYLKPMAIMFTQKGFFMGFKWPVFNEVVKLMIILTQAFYMK